MRLEAVGENETCSTAIPAAHGVGQKAFHGITKYAPVRGDDVHEQIEVAVGVIARVAHIDEDIVWGHRVGDPETERRP